MSAMLLRWVWLFLPPILCHTSLESFSVVVPPDPVTGFLGASVYLPCTLSNKADAITLEVRWYRPNMYDAPVLLYYNRRIVESRADRQYWDRASLLGGLEKGNVTLKLENLTLADRGDYVCHVSSDMWYDMNKVSLQVKVVGSTPVLSVAKAEKQANVTCQSHGWFPEPSVIWTDRGSRDLKNLSKVKFTTDSEGLVNVCSWLLVPPSESEWLSCSVGLSASNQETKESRVLPHTPAVAESTTGPFIVTLVLLLLCVTGFAVYCVLHQKGLIGPKRKNMLGTREPDQPEPNASTSFSASDHLLTESTFMNTTSGLSEKEESLPGGITYTSGSSQDLHLQMDHFEYKPVNPQTAMLNIQQWDQVMRFKVNITIDQNEKPKFFKTGQEGTKLNYFQPNDSDNSRDNAKDFCLCKEQFSSGKQYWEVKVWQKPKEKLSWYVGVARDTAERMYKIPLIPKNGFWVLCYEEEYGIFFTDDASQVPLKLNIETFTKVGVFLDCDEHTLSFYNVDTQSHIHTLCGVEAKLLYPLISPGTRDEKPVQIVK